MKPLARIVLLAALVIVVSTCGESPTGGGPPVPSSLSIVAGNSQTDTIGAHLATPLQVRVLSAAGAGIPNVTVRFRASGNGSVVPDLATTDATGVAFTHWMLRTLSGPDTAIATVAVLPNEPAVFTATVQPGRLALLTITPDTVRFFKLQDTTALRAQGEDRAHNAVVLGRLTWAIAGSTSIIASIDTAGVVRSLGPGSTSASATDIAAGIFATAHVIVSQAPATVIITNPGSDTLNWLGQLRALSPAAYDFGGYLIFGAPFTWRSLDTSVAQVQVFGGSGLVTAVRSGTARIVADFQGLADTATIIVRQLPASVVINVSDTLDAFSDTASASGVVRDSGGTAIAGVSLAWSSSNSGIVEVVAPAVIVSRANGGAIVSASLGAIQDTERVVVSQRVADVQVQPPSASLAIGQTQQFNAVAYDRHGFTIDPSFILVPGVWRPLQVDWLSVSPTGVATARAAGTAGVVFKQATAADTASVTVLDPGLGPVTSWEWKNPLPQGNSLYGLSGNADNNIYAVGLAGTILHFDGATWTLKPRADAAVLVDAWVSPTGQLFAAGGAGLSYGVLVHGYDSPWTTDTIPSSSVVRAVWGVTDTSVFAVNDAYRVLKFNGTTWSEIGSLPLIGVQDIEGVSSQLLFVSGSALEGLNSVGVIYRYDGTTWTEVYRGFVTVIDLWVAPDSSVYALGRTNNCSSSLLHSNGASWDTLTTFADDITRIHGRTSQDIYGTGGCNGFDDIAHWDGNSATLDPHPGLNFPQQVWGSASGYWVAVGGYGAIQTNAGAGWQTVTTGLRGQQYNVRGLEGWVPGADTAYITSHDSRILRWDGAALTEVATPFAGVPSPISGYGRPLEGIWGSSSSDLYVGGGFRNACYTPPTDCDGILAHFDGNSWQVIYNQGIVIHTIWGTAPDDIFALGHQAGLHFDGSSWSRTGQGVFDTDQILAVWGYRSNDIWACGENRDIYHYDGQSWSKFIHSTIGCGAMIGFAPNDIYMAGFSDGPNGTVTTVGHYDGFAWSVVYTGGLPNGDYSEVSIWGSGPHDVQASFGSEYVRFDGNSWQRQPLPPMGPMTITGDSRGHIFGSGELAGFVIGHQ